MPNNNSENFPLNRNNKRLKARRRRQTPAAQDFEFNAANEAFQEEQTRKDWQILASLYPDDEREKILEQRWLETVLPAMEAARANNKGLKRKREPQQEWVQQKKARINTIAEDILEEEEIDDMLPEEWKGAAMVDDHHILLPDFEDGLKMEVLPMDEEDVYLPTLSMITWNFEKYGPTTPALVREAKQAAITSILDTYHPAIMVMQEVSNAPLLLKGDQAHQIPGLEDQNLNEQYQNEMQFEATFPTALRNLHARLNLGNFRTVIGQYRSGDPVANLKNLKKDLANKLSLLQDDNTPSTLLVRQILSNAIQKTKKKVTAINSLIKTKDKKKTQIDKAEANKRIKRRLEHLESELEGLNALLNTNLNGNEGIDPNLYADTQYRLQLAKVLKAVQDNVFKGAGNELMEDDIPLPPYSIRNEYRLLEGPRFGNAKNLKGGAPDYYPCFYDTAVFHGEPELYTADLNSQMVGEGMDDYLKQHDPCQSNHFRYGNIKKGKDIRFGDYTDALGNRVFEEWNLDKDFLQNRRLVLWKFKLPTKRYYLRERKGRQPYQEYMPLFVGVIHTSPSINIRNEVDACLEVMRDLAEKSGIPVLVGGDWYMQKKAAKAWYELAAQVPEEGEWRQENWFLVEPGVNTNYFNNDSEGQIADHFVGERMIFNEEATTAVSPHEFRLGKTEQNPLLQKTQSEMENWLGIKVDHAPIYTSLTINLETVMERLLNKEKKCT